MVYGEYNIGLLSCFSKGQRASVLEQQSSSPTAPQQRQKQPCMGVRPLGVEAPPGIRSLAFHFLWVLHSWLLAAQFFLSPWFIGNSERTLKSPGHWISSIFLWLLSSGPQASCVPHTGYFTNQGLAPA